MVPDLGLEELNPGMPFTTGQFRARKTIIQGNRERKTIIYLTVPF